MLLVFYHNNQVLRIFCKFFSRVFNKPRWIWSRLVKISDKKFCKKFLGLGCCDKIASENDFNGGRKKINFQIPFLKPISIKNYATATVYYCVHFCGVSLLRFERIFYSIWRHFLSTPCPHPVPYLEGYTLNLRLIPISLKKSILSGFLLNNLLITIFEYTNRDCWVHFE